jgi:hypothetical protein
MSGILGVDVGEVTKYEPEDDGFSNSQRNHRTRGFIIKWDDTNGWHDRDDMAVPSPLVVVAVDEFYRRWKNNELTDIREKPLPDLDELNAGIPIEKWEKGFDGKPAKPFSHHVGVYLVDPAKGTPYKYEANTAGAHMAFDALVEAVATMRMLRGAHVMPVVNLGERKWKSKTWGWQTRPDFEIINYKAPGGDLQAVPAKPDTPQLSGPASIEPSPPPSPAPSSPANTAAQPYEAKPKPPVNLASETLSAMGDVKPVTTAEIMDDSIPW